jgi:hypothetical protein
MPYPIANGENITDAINYVLSGPGGLGQNFAGVSGNDDAYITGNYRTPFTQKTQAKMYVAPINLSNAQQIDARTIKYTFSSAQPSAPFAPGNGLTIKGITPTTYNTSSLTDAGYSIIPIGVIECTTTYVVVRTVSDITTALGSYVSGGTVEYSSMDFYNSTDCDIRIQVLGGQERVFVAAQVDQEFDYTVLTGTPNMTMFVEINRYTAYTNNDPTNPEFIFLDQTNIASKSYEYTALTTGSKRVETIFTNVFDNPNPGFYRYILEVYFKTFGSTTDIQVTKDLVRFRSISAQVIKP